MLNPQLKQRIITASWCLPLALACILVPTEGTYRPLWLGAQVVLMALFIGAGIEWTRMMRFKPWIARFFCIGLTAALLGDMLFFKQIPITAVWGIVLLWWVFGLTVVLRYQKAPFKRLGGTSLALLMGACLLLPPYFSVLYLKTVTPQHNLLLYAILVIWCADTAAYFVGKRFGRHKLASSISPGKTQEGFLGALLSVWLLSVLLYCLQGKGSIQHFSFVQWMLWVTMIVLASVLGDLLESVMKRIQGVKDSGSILPGHGGILDRIDSLTAALPIAAVTHWLMLVK
jgi:phosphatidate cytidylyltransferase